MNWRQSWPQQTVGLILSRTSPRVRERVSRMAEALGSNRSRETYVLYEADHEQSGLSSVWVWCPHFSHICASFVGIVCVCACALRLFSWHLSGLSAPVSVRHVGQQGSHKAFFLPPPSPTALGRTLSLSQAASQHSLSCQL